ncbi:hypothetical protein C8Q75DRAFT_761537 [Abortiporus biennis]|nr:hypothetical protein C8Q75DRAFT_761537 [Abortiporus biennis]
MSATLISHLMLNLRDPDILYPELRRISENRVTLTGGTLEFNTIDVTSQAESPIVSTVVYVAYSGETVTRSTQSLST